MDNISAEEYVISRINDALSLLQTVDYIVSDVDERLALLGEPCDDEVADMMSGVIETIDDINISLRGILDRLCNQ